MSGRGDRQKLGKPFDDREDNCVQEGHFQKCYRRQPGGRLENF
jgi:hypothetical protein